MKAIVVLLCFDFDGSDSVWVDLEVVDIWLFFEGCVDV